MKCLRGLSVLAVAILVQAVLADEQCSEKRRQENLYSPGRLFEQDFGVAIMPDDFLAPFVSPFSMFRDYIRPWRHLARATSDLGSTIKADKDQFQINLDVQHFAPDEISVKTADGYVVIEAKHEEKKDDHGFVSRQFVRKYSLPEGVEPETVTSQLSSDGVLTVSAPRKAIEGKGERPVAITRTGPVRKQAQEESCQSETCDKEKK